jgi:hypothetical protein
VKPSRKEGRTCARCQAALSAYNPSPLCYSCQIVKRNEIAGEASKPCIDCGGVAEYRPGYPLCADCREVRRVKYREQENERKRARARERYRETRRRV